MAQLNDGLSKRQRKLARKQRPAQPAVPRVVADVRPVVEEPAINLRQLAPDLERAAAEVAIRQAAELAARDGVELTAADKRAIRRDHGVTMAKGQVRLRSRDGLVSLNDTGSLTDEELKAGLAYRHCYEAAAGGLRSALGQTEGGGRSLPVGFALRNAAALQRAYVMARLAQMERTVGAEMLDGRELTVLRMVAGEGRTLSSLAAGGNAKVANLSALRRALASVARVLPVRGLRIRDD